MYCCSLLTSTPEFTLGLTFKLQVNRIRQSLSLIAHNSTAFGLAQPHLDRTRLCTLEDSALDPAYVRQRSRLQSLVKSLARPKVTVYPSAWSLCPLCGFLCKHLGAV